MRYDAMSVAGVPSTFAVGGVHDRSSTPSLIVAQPESTEASTTSVTSWSRTRPVIGSSAAQERRECRRADHEFSREENLVPKGGLEPPRVAPHAPQTCASASSATSARCEAKVQRYRERLTIRPTLWRSLGSSASRIPSPTRL